MPGLYSAAGGPRLGDLCGIASVSSSGDSLLRFDGLTEVVELNVMNLSRSTSERLDAWFAGLITGT